MAHTTHRTHAATAAVRRRGQETHAAKLRAAGWAVVPPTTNNPDPFGLALPTDGHETVDVVGRVQHEGDLVYVSFGTVEVADPEVAEFGGTVVLTPAERDRLVHALTDRAGHPPQQESEPS